MREIEKLEKYFGGTHAIVVNTKQLAIQMCLEVLGSRTHLIPCILPVTAPVDTMAGILRSGAHPLLLDVDPTTLHINLDDLKTALEALQGAAVVLVRVAGYPIPEEILEAVQDVPTIVDHRLIPHDALIKSPRNLCGTFNVYDLQETLIQSGAVIFHKFEQQQKDLRTLRDGIMGHQGALAEPLCIKIREALRWFDSYEKDYHNLIQSFSDELNESKCNDIILWEAAEEAGLLYFTVPNAKEVLKHLHAIGITKAKYAFFPLHFFEEVRRRFQEIPAYPIAEQLMNQSITLPASAKFFGQEKYIISKMIEILEEEHDTSSFTEDDSEGTSTRTSEE
jgi:dTDP-4-amino-4,6-dideoxygalactose transaminase